MARAETGRGGASDPRRLKVGTSGRFLVWDDGSPFFYLGDTAWELFHRLDREEADAYLKDRAEEKFTVIQAVVLAEMDGLDVPNAYGHLPLVDKNPTRPNEAYFEHVDYIVNKAGSLGLHVGMLPTWGSCVADPAPIFDASNARTYGEFLGERYRDEPVIWIPGGDRAAVGFEDVWRAMAEGLAAGDQGRHLITYHPRGHRSSSMWLHHEAWLDFNMAQSGHSRAWENYTLIAEDYMRSPAKPCMDGEPCYENITEGLEPPEKARWSLGAADVRRAAYWALFAGACGHTYGCNEVYQFWAPGRPKPRSRGRGPLARRDPSARCLPDAARARAHRIAPLSGAGPRPVAHHHELRKCSSGRSALRSGPHSGHARLRRELRVRLHAFRQAGRD